MEFWLTIIGLVRRRRVIVPLLLVAAASGALAFTATPPTYVSHATMVLTLTQYGGSESRDPATPTDLINPMLNFNDSLVTTSAIIINTMNTKDVARQLAVDGSSELVVDDGRSDPDLLGLNGPFINIRATSSSPSAASRITEAAQVLMREKLQAWQRTLQAPKATYIQLVDVVPPSVPEIDRSRPTKYALLATGLGGGVGLLVAYVGHRTKQRRAARAAARGPVSGELAARPSPTRATTGPERSQPRRPKTQPRRPQAEPPRPQAEPHLPERVLRPDVSDPDPDRELVPKVPVKKNGPRR